VVGLGNPGPRYEPTRHNVGFRVLGRLCERWAAQAPRRQFDGQVYQARLDRPGRSSVTVLMLAPMTYMNASGRAVRAMVDYYKAPLSDLLVVLDDAALPLGQIRIRATGSAGGHNGLMDVLEALASEQVPRLRIGIDAPPAGMDLRDYVLSPFSDQQQQAMERTIETAADAVEDWIFEGITYVMEKYNRKTTSEQ